MAAWETARDGANLWKGTPEFLSLLFGARLPIEEWLSQGRARIIKSGLHRTVYHVATPQGGIFLKRYRVTGWGGRLQQLFRLSPAERELRSLIAVGEAGVPTAVPLAGGLSFQGSWISDSWLALREIVGVVPLDEQINQAASAQSTSSVRERRRLAVAVGELLGRFHGSGFLHQDLHAGNLLVRAMGDRYLAWLIDLHEVKSLGRPLSGARIAQNLALFDHFFLGRATASDRLRFFQAWNDAFRSAEHGTCLLTFEEMARHVESRCRFAERRAFRKRDRKWRRGNRRLIIADMGSVRCRGLSEIGRELLERFRAAPEEALADLCRAMGPLEARRVETPRVAGWRTLFRRDDGAASRTWEMGHALLRRGIPSVRPLCFLETDDGRLCRGVVVLEEKGGESLSQHLRQPGGVPFRPRGRPTAPWLVPLARALRQLHHRGFRHEALSAEAIGVGLSAPSESNDGEAIIWFDSIDRVRSSRRLSLRVRTQQLARLAESVLRWRPMRCTEALRFLKTYLSPAERHEWKRWWNGVRGAVAAMRSIPPLESSSVAPSVHRHGTPSRRRAG